MFIITTNGDCKVVAEKTILDQFTSIECAICLDDINVNNRGVIYITSGGTADLERVMCGACDKRFQNNDPYKRSVEYRFEFPFHNDEHAKLFLAKSSRFVLNDGDDDNVERFSSLLKGAATEFRDVEIELGFRL
ncbi:hypothetical protein [Clostera anachoreta granulovirus]|uniref:Uncharacterized protein n=1 Tax=Clostera anachoreta granulovirus TaxID=283675 RepID=Q6BD77_9BBAC|nr:hypothetical protein ClanGV_gp115 [Clostera anachoreta granulovirus]AAT77799.1 unknown [Clostera anachoreta granulovirus]AEB00403.1 hypothetical protein [Clostera anachoreta granulovirus]